MAEISSRSQQYLIAQSSALHLASGPSMSFQDIQELMERDPQIEVQRVIPSRNLDLLSGTEGAQQGVLVASMPNHVAQQVAASPQVEIEPDLPLFLADPMAVPAALNPMTLLPMSLSTSYNIQVVGDNGTEVADAAVYLYGDSVPAMGKTDANGKVSITLQTHSSSDVTGLYVNPKLGYWNRWVSRPQLDAGGTTTVTLTPLSSTFPKLDAEETYGWGQVAMGLPEVPETYRGQGVRIAIVDSGAAALTHPDLKHISAGQDLTVIPPSQNWTTDVIAHGSHCAGVITGSLETGGVRGFAPDAEIHVIKIFPGGRFSSLLDALDYCIDHRIDIVNLSLGTAEGSDLIRQKISQARSQGVGCIVAAGNSGGAVQFPGTSPDVLTVAAIGKIGAFPQTSYHELQIGQLAQSTDSANKYFSARFTCYGPEVDVCAPGVAVLSTVPNEGFAAWDGTSMATPHVSGAAALLLAHHPDFKAEYRERTNQRVEHLFELLKASAIPVNVGDPHRTGAGMPNIARALQISAPPSTGDASLQEALRDFIRGLLSHSDSGDMPSATDSNHHPIDSAQKIQTILNRLAQRQ